MTKLDLIVHRGNSPFNMSTPTEQVGYYVNAGFKKIEIDVYALSEATYKFCHPLDANNVNETHTLHDGYLEDFVKRYSNVEWLVDLKCLDLDEAPEAMMQYLIDVFGTTALYIAAQKKILEFMHHRNMRTGRYFRDAINLSYKPDFYMLSAASSVQYPTQETILSCISLGQGLDYLTKDFAGIMVDGNLLI